MKDIDESEYRDDFDDLDIIQNDLELAITSAEIIKTENLYHEDDDCVIRAFTFNKGIREQIVVIGADGHIYANVTTTDRPVSPRLIRTIVPVLLKYLINYKWDTENQKKIKPAL
tara:strand:+ start:5083 stop:5424 length:342 start_codon:yes stop_codon:yes gene_type:complete